MSQKRKTVTPWFKKYMKPTQQQFKTLFQSIWFKDENIPATNIENLSNLLNDKADTELVTTLTKEINQLKSRKAGLMNLVAIEIPGNTPTEFVIPNGALLYGLEALADANISIGTSATETDDLGTFDASQNRIIEVILQQRTSIFITSDVAVSVEPIIYMKQYIM